MIDVSQYNGIISWDKVVADAVIIRAGYRGYSAGVIKQDARLSENLAGVIRYNIPFGLYFMSQAISESEAEAEALFCLDIVKGMDIKFPIFYDSEYSGKAGNTGRADGISKAQRTAVCVRFCETIKSGGKIPGVYASKSWFSDHLIPEQLKSYSIWVAQYNKECTLSVLDWNYWQYTSKGSVPGITGNVDLSRAKKSQPAADIVVVKNSPMIEVAAGVQTYSKKTDGQKKFSIGGRESNFRVCEFSCHDGSDEIKVSEDLIMKLQEIREHFGKPVSITSAYRTEAYNKKVGGAKSSYHVKGMAADITVTGVSNRDVAIFAESITNGVGLYDYTGGFVHVDVRPEKYLWQQDSKNSKYYSVSGFSVKEHTPTTLRYNDRGANVTWVQQKLGLEEDGIFGPKTEAAVREFQKTAGLIVDGVVGKNTWACLMGK